MSKNVLVPIADGSEEIEAVTMIDVLRRAGADVTVASVNDLKVTASRGVKLEADCLISECTDQAFDLVALPGGMPGAENLGDNRDLKRILLLQKERGGLYGAICAAPAMVLNPWACLKARRPRATRTIWRAWKARKLCPRPSWWTAIAPPAGARAQPSPLP